MANQIITLETGKLIPDRYNKRSYWPDSKWFYIDTTKELGYYLADVNDMDIDYPAPTQTELAKWLRDVHDIHIVVMPTEYTTNNITKIKWYFKLQYLTIGFDSYLSGFILLETVYFNTYELALEAGLKQVLKLIK